MDSGHGRKMTDTTDLIRWAAEYVGWQLRGYHSNGKAWYSDNIQTVYCPALVRAHFHALTGVVEDKVRMEYCIILTIWADACEVENLDNKILVKNEDLLIARLGALMQLVEKINE